MLITRGDNLEIISHVYVRCPFGGCLININILGDLLLGEYASILGGTFIIHAINLFLQNNSLPNTTSLGGAPPQMSGTPLGVDSVGAHHGGIGALLLQ